MTLTTPQREALRGLIKQAVEEKPRRQAPRLLLAAVGTAAIVATIVAIAVVAPGATSAQAAEALRAAAHETITATDPSVGPGQYLKVTTEAAYLAYESAADGSLTAYLSPSTTEVWMPQDGAADWVQRETFKPATAFYGKLSIAAAKRDWQETKTSGVVRITRAANGKFVVVHELGGEVNLGELPTTPTAALRYLRSTPDPSDVGALGLAAQLLRDGTMKAAQRAVLYRALALIPTIRITDDDAVLDGRTGVAFSLDPTGKLDRTELIIDPATGQYIGERETATVAQGAVPAGTKVAYTAVTTEVVDSAP